MQEALVEKGYAGKDLTKFIFQIEKLSGRGVVARANCGFSYFAM